MIKMIIYLFLCNVTILSAFDCENAGNMNEIKSCSNQEFKSVDRELNIIYKKVIQSLDDIGKKKLIIAQRAWLAYRDSKAEFAADFARGGTLAGYLYIKSIIKSTQQRTQELVNTTTIYNQ